MSAQVSSRKQAATRLLVAAVVGICLVLVAARATRSEAKAAVPPCTNPVTILVAASSEKAALLKGTAQAYNSQHHQIDGDCAQASVISVASGTEASAIVDNWSRTTDGPRPDVWTPAASAWLVLVQQQLMMTDKSSVVPLHAPSIMQTPLVIAMPKPMAEALGWPQRSIGWSDLFQLASSPQGWGLFGHPEWGQFRLGKTNPHISTSGLNATIATFFAGTGLTADLSVAAVHSKPARAFVKQIESSVAHYGDTTLTFLGNMAAADAAGEGLGYVSAVTVEEKSVWDYNMGNPSGDPATLGKGPKPKTPLVAIYPREGTLVSDSPFAVLNEPWVDNSKRDIAADFLAFVRSPQQQSRFQAAAFRSFSGQPGAPINPGNGLDPSGPKVVLAPPSPAVLGAIYDSWDQLRKRARVLFVMDISGSMGDSVGIGYLTKLDLAKRAVLAAIRQFAPDDQVGLWVFSGTLGNGMPYEQVVPIGPASKTVPLLDHQVPLLQEQNGTALYYAIRAARRAMVAGLDRSKINAVVVLTDGHNEFPQDQDLTSLLAELNSGGLDDSIRVFTVGYGSDADGAALTAIAGASKAAYYSASDPTTIAKVFTAVLSNF